MSLVFPLCQQACESGSCGRSSLRDSTPKRSGPREAPPVERVEIVEVSPGCGREAFGKAVRFTFAARPLSTKGAALSSQGNALGLPAPVSLFYFFMQDIIIDKIAISEKTGAVILCLHHNDPWDDDAVFQSLLARVNGYVSTLESGFVAQQVPQAAGRPALLRIVFTSRLSDKASRWLAALQARLQERGIGLELVYVGY